MNTSKRFMQAYRQAPWRIQTQRAALVLLVAVMGAAVLWLMLSVTVQAGAAGLQIQQYEGDREQLQRDIADLRTQYAVLTSATRMEKKAAEMGFAQVKPDHIQYMVIPNYQGRQSSVQAAPPDQGDARPLIKPIYTESLWEWMLQGIMRMSEQQGGVSP